MNAAIMQVNTESSAKIRPLSNLAPYHRPPLGLGTRLLRDNCIDYRTGARLFGAWATRGSTKSLRAITEQSSHIGEPAFIGTEMNS